MQFKGGHVKGKLRAAQAQNGGASRVRYGTSVLQERSGSSLARGVAIKPPTEPLSAKELVSFEIAARSVALPTSIYGRKEPRTHYQYMYMRAAGNK